MEGRRFRASDWDCVSDCASDVVAEGRAEYSLLVLALTLSSWTSSPNSSTSNAYVYVVRNGGGFSLRAFLPDPRERQPQDDELDDVTGVGVDEGVGEGEGMDWNDFRCFDDDEDEDEVCERRPGR